MSITSPRYGFEVFANNLDKDALSQTSDSLSLNLPTVKVEDNNDENSYTEVIVFSSPSPSPPPPADMHTATRLPHEHQDQHLKQETIDFETQFRSDVADSSEQNLGEVNRLRRKVFDLNVRLMISEGMARSAEAEVVLWKSRYDELKETTGGASAPKRCKRV